MLIVKARVAASAHQIFTGEQYSKKGRNMGFHDKHFFAKSFSVRLKVPGFMLLSGSTAFNGADFVSTSSTTFKGSPFHSFLCTHVATFAARQLSFNK